MQAADQVTVGGWDLRQGSFCMQGGVGRSGVSVNTTSAQSALATTVISVG